MRLQMDNDVALDRALLRLSSRGIVVPETFHSRISAS